MPTTQATERKHPPRPAISQRPWSHAQRMLRQAGISQRDIADATELPVSTVNRALSFARCGQTQHHTVLRVRQAVEALLQQTGTPTTPADLWHEYDSTAL